MMLAIAHAMASHAGFAGILFSVDDHGGQSSIDVAVVVCRTELCKWDLDWLFPDTQRIGDG